MKKTYKKLVYGAMSAVVVFLLLVPTISDYLYWIMPLKEAEFVPILSPCDEDCKINNEAKGFTCTQMDIDDYMCRAPLRIDPRSLVQYAYVTPVDYGEFVYYPEKTEMDSGIMIEILDQDTIKVVFRSYENLNIPNDFEFTANISKGQMFVKYCSDTTLHTLTFTDIIEVDEKTYIEFWARLVNTPDNIRCEYPEIIKHSISAFS